MKFRLDTILASFVVAIFSSFLTALGVLLVKTIALSVFKADFIADLINNLFILFFLSGFIFFKGSSVAAWMLYRHDVAWGYKLAYKRVLPIFILSFIMALVVFFAVYYYVTTEVPALAYLGRSAEIIQQRVLR